MISSKVQILHMIKNKDTNQMGGSLESRGLVTKLRRKQLEMEAERKVVPNMDPLMDDKPYEHLNLKHKQVLQDRSHRKALGGEEG